MRKVPFIVAGVVAMTTAYAEAAPPSEGPQIAIQAPNSPRAPTDLVVIACRSDDLTGKPGRHGVDPVTGEYDPTLAARNWRDLEPKVVDGALECKREVNQLQDQTVVMDPTGKLAKPLNSNFGNLAQCASASMFWSTQWNDAHPGWAVVATGCPTPIVDEQGVIKGWKMPDCPRFVGKCKFDESLI